MYRILFGEKERTKQLHPQDILFLFAPIIMTICSDVLFSETKQHKMNMMRNKVHQNLIQGIK